jgi:SAM-dependent methyltransferase
VLAAGDTPDRRALWRRHFASGPPRKLRSVLTRLPLGSARVLDVGCGYGVYLVHFGAGSVGVDRDRARVAFARSLGRRAEVRDVEQPGWTEGLGRFDFVWLCDLLPHVEDPRALLRTVTEVLAPGGALVISEWLWPTARCWRALALRLPGARRVHDHPEHRHRFTRVDLDELLDEAGLAVEDSWIHTVRAGWIAGLIHPFWPPRTVVARVASGSRAATLH